MRRYHVYILSSNSRVLYVGVSGNLVKRLDLHRDPTNKGFTGRYRVHRLVYVEETSNVLAAIAREKEIKGWRRSKKFQLISKANPGWEDLMPRPS